MGTPRISLGLPVYNGANFLPETLDCVLAQTFEDFELVISDNASTDESEEICRDYARRDRRIRYVRQPQNLGAVSNFNEVAKLSQSPYFKWVAHDDLMAPSFLERCYDELQLNPAAILCMPRCAVIDDDGRRIVGDEADGARMSSGQILTDEVFPQRSSLLRSRRVADRYRAVLVQSRRCYELFALIRMEVLRKTPLLRPFANSEKVLLTELALLGPWCEVPEMLFFSRWHRERFTNSSSTQQRNRHWNPRAKNRFVWPHQPRCAWGYFAAPWRYGVSLGDRMDCLGAFGQFVFQVRRWPSILRGAVRGTGMTVTIPATPPVEFPPERNSDLSRSLTLQKESA